MNDLIRKVENWAETRGLIPGNPKYQTVKLMEEIGELSEGIIKNRPEQIKDGIGDSVVVLTILARQVGMTLEECLEYAYNQIKDRKGKTKDSVFVKEEDLDAPSTSKEEPKDIPLDPSFAKQITEYRRDFFRTKSINDVKDVVIVSREKRYNLVTSIHFIPLPFYFHYLDRVPLMGEVGVMLSPSESLIIVEDLSDIKFKEK